MHVIFHLKRPINFFCVIRKQWLWLSLSHSLDNRHTKFSPNRIIHWRVAQSKTVHLNRTTKTIIYTLLLATGAERESNDAHYFANSDTFASHSLLSSIAQSAKKTRKKIAWTSSLSIVQNYKYQIIRCNLMNSTCDATENCWFHTKYPIKIHTILYAIFCRTF